MPWLEHSYTVRRSGQRALGSTACCRHTTACCVKETTPTTITHLRIVVMVQQICSNFAHGCLAHSHCGFPAWVTQVAAHIAFGIGRCQGLFIAWLEDGHLAPGFIGKEIGPTHALPRSLRILARLQEEQPQHNSCSAHMMSYAHAHSSAHSYMQPCTTAVAQCHLPYPTAMPAPHSASACGC